MNKSTITQETYNKSAFQYQSKFMNFNLYNEMYDAFCEAIKIKNPEIFEIACGPGNITRYLLNKRPDFNIFGIDYSEKMIELALQNNPSASFKVMDCKFICEIKKEYDGVVCGFCLPYLNKEEAVNLIADVSKLLKKEGVFYLSTMEDDYDKSGFEEPSFSEEGLIYVHYHQYDYLVNAFTDNGFAILDFQYKNYPEKDGRISKDMVFILKKVS
ncbi:MAG TPA: class I SAM-dependent methyltransferase [Bacteroidales bacterium]|nr:class I SAM-dependent methyltransferase [Bacteroidales bacterium]